MESTDNIDWWELINQETIMDWLIKLKKLIKDNRTGTVVVVIAVVFLFLSNARGNYTLTDALSALADVSMAILALIGLSVANKWRREATQNKGVDIGIDILTDSLPLTKNLFSPPVYILLAKVYCSSCKEDKKIKFKHALSLKRGLNGYDSIISREGLALAKLKERIKLLNVVSWKISHSYESTIHNYIKLLSDCYTKELELLVNIGVVLANWNLKIGEEEINPYDALEWNLSNYPVIDTALQLCIDIIRIKEDLHYIVEQMDLDSVSIFDVFEPAH
ncbi:TPA: hypothetical protein ACSXT8_002935 [Escherichia coli]